jgi:transglutaminase-like putative cysteine protease
MTSSIKQFITLRKTGMITACLLLAASLQAQDHYKYDTIASKYASENAVYSNITERLVIKEEDGQLTANSYVVMEKLLISDLSINHENTDFFAYSSFQRLTDYTANAYLPAKNSYKKVPCHHFGEGRPRDFVFYDDQRVVEVYYSGLAKNAITETKYSLEHTDLNMLPRFTFQEDLPVVNATFEVVAPRHVNLGFVLKGLDVSHIKETKEEKNGIITFKFTATDMPAFKRFSNVPSRWHYIPHVIPYIKSYRTTGAKKDSILINGPDDLYKYLYNYVKGINMKEDTFISRTVAEITKNDVREKDKAAHIYEWVQKNMHYIAFEKGLEGFVPREASLVCKRKYGDCKDMASTLVAMCRKAGLNAYFTWIGTRELPYTHEETPLNCVSNHMICAVKIGEEWLFLDATNPLLPLGANRDDIQGKEAMIAIDAKNYKIVTIPERAADKNVTFDSTFMSISDRTIRGNVKQSYKGYEAWEIGILMSMYNQKDEREKAIKALTGRGSNKYLQSRYDVAVNPTGDKDVNIEAGFTIEDYVQKVGKQYYVNMNLNRDFENNQIEIKDRKVPYFNDYKQKKKEVVVLEIPKGYRVSHLPPAANGAADGWQYKISYKADAKKITLTKEYEIKALAIGPLQFADNNKMVDNLKKSYKESVVLTAN